MDNEKHNFHAGTNIFVKENLTPMNETIAYKCRKVKHSSLIHACYSRNGNAYTKENVTSRSIKVFRLGKLISLFPDHLQNNDENDQYMQTVHCSHHINMIISAGLNAMLVCCHPTVINQLRLVDWREICFAWRQPTDRFIYLFFLWN